MLVRPNQPGPLPKVVKVQLSLIVLAIITLLALISEIAVVSGAGIVLGAAALTKRVRPGPLSKVEIALLVYFIAIIVAITWAFFRMAG